MAASAIRISKVVMASSWVIPWRPSWSTGRSVAIMQPCTCGSLRREPGRIESGGQAERDGEVESMPNQDRPLRRRWRVALLGLSLPLALASTAQTTDAPGTGQGLVAEPVLVDVTPD